MSKKIKIGVLGCADIAKRFLIPALIESPGFNLVGIASRTKKKANLFAKLFDTNAFHNYESLLDDQIDAVYIPLPNGLHFNWIKKALEKDLHVLVEKSLACSLKEVIELNKIAKERKLVLLENFQFRFHSQLEYIKNKIKNGELGEVHLIRSSFGFPPFNDKDNIRYNKEIGGGSLLDAGAYTLKVSQIFLGENIFVDSAQLTYSDEYEIDISGSGLLKQKDGKATAQVAFGFNHFYQNCLEVWGSKGRIKAKRIFTAGPDIEPPIHEEDNQHSKLIYLHKDNHFNNMLLHFSSLISGSKELDNEYNQNFNQARLIEEFRKKSMSF
mgnify:CR=1 FL=1